ncbi:arginine N-succinyltransferase [Sphingomonas nostoxanthinifaciens]|uniref:arginine N-succinyltransferase n=1 Tax=Sphingomonas nostoxanthinifaciens TaxID=2872652 RepID=UPI001CC1DB8C|nr:arginine N-succinyltransferase [Sphingomonas nostoxanthinifaciens]UAK26209.1 arginine N-succinyltransferase [Sphingomonas nostoxanthinifaciens]
MAAIVRPARADDLDALYEMAKLAGGGFTNLPADRPALADRLARSAAAFARTGNGVHDDVFLLILEDRAEDRVAGTAQIMARVGETAPFHSYRRGVLTQHSPELGRSFRTEMLSLTTDLEGSTEVGGLFLHPRYRAGGLGLLLARSRYLFIRRHRARFADRVIAELRGVIDEAGAAPFWDGIAGRFLGMDFREADAFNAINGHHAIANLMPKHPIYLAMLPEPARAVVGVPHPTGRAAMRMLETEGFAYDGYLDIFDGGPTLSAPTDRIRTVGDAREGQVSRVDGDGGNRSLVATGEFATFRAGFALVGEVAGEVMIDPIAADLLTLGKGDTILHIAR